MSSRRSRADGDDAFATRQALFIVSTRRYATFAL